MKALTMALLVLVLVFPLCAATIVTQPFPPARFTSLYIEKYDKGNAVIVQSTGDTVTFKVTSAGTEIDNETIRPSADDWFKFIQSLNQAKVYKWAPNYEYPGQGATWVIDFTMDGLVFKSGGTSDYPKNGDETKPAADPKAGPSIPFQLFWQAVLELVGKAPPPPQTK